MKSIDKFNITEDLTCRGEIGDKENDDKKQEIFGISIEPEPFEDHLKKKDQHEETEFSFASLRNTKTVIFAAKGACNRLIIRNNMIAKRIWDIIIELILAYNIITTLFFLSYEYPTGGILIVDIICWIFFIIDIVINFYTEQKNDKGERVNDFVGIANIYMKGWLIFDLVSIIPLRSAGYEMAEYLLRMFRLLKLPGVIDITDGTGVSYLLTFFSFGRREKNGKITYSYTSKIIASLTKLFIIIIFIVYFLGCFWYWFQGIVSNYRFSSAKDGVDENTFENAFGLEGMHSKDIALRSSYFMLTTIATIGYGDFLPRNIYEMSFILVAMLFGVTLFAVIMGNFNSALAYYTEATSATDCLGELHLWLRSLERIHGDIDKDLKTKIINHFKYYFEKDRLKCLAKNYWEAETPDDLINVDQQYVSSLPESDYFEIMDCLYSDFFSNFYFFFKKSKIKYAIVPHLQPRYYGENKLILKRFREVNEIVFVTSGYVGAGINFNRKFYELLRYEIGRTIIGDYPILAKKINQFDYIAFEISEGLAIDSKAFNTILSTYCKNDKKNLLTIAFIREKNLKRLLDVNIKDGILPNVTEYEEEKEFDFDIPKEAAKDIEIDNKVVAKDLSTLADNGKDANKKLKSLIKVAKKAKIIRKKGFAKIKL
ncbi:hypothetical protein SteCoe_21942 [Stentor coeruleus]|uniref:Ion transport domain-containing protein n=1 Tax=Stentor coeruleus TaxID=5963 RepID=A0A1R2BND1_9CILI|nr:hypothetical protein SteCoe_21942 [Stentor coeruleus]